MLGEIFGDMFRFSTKVYGLVLFTKTEELKHKTMYTRKPLRWFHLLLSAALETILTYFCLAPQDKLKPKVCKNTMKIRKNRDRKCHLLNSRLHDLKERRKVGRAA